MADYTRLPSPATINAMADYARRKDAHFSYIILETIEAGITLAGHEVKAVRAGKASLNGSYAVLRGGEAYLLNCSIEPFQTNNTPIGYEPLRVRKLLLKKTDLARLARELKIKGVTLVPLSLYPKGDYIKVSLALAKGKKAADKRQSIKKRESTIEMQRLLK